MPGARPPPPAPLAPGAGALAWSWRNAAAKGAELREKYGPQIGWKELLRILNDRACVRYP